MATIPDYVMPALGIVTPAAALAAWFILNKSLLSAKTKIPLNERKRFSYFLLAGLLGWLAISFVFGWLEIFRNFSFLVLIFGYGIPYLANKFLNSSQMLQLAVDSAPNHWLIGIQLYRVLGIIFLTMYAAGLLPAAFAIPSGVGDIIVGLSAPVVAYLLFKKTSNSKKLAIFWNYIGILDLIIALTMGPITAPTPVQLLSFDAPNLPIISYPLVSVPAFAVPFSLILHLFSLRILGKKFKL
ncbi:MAG TPA: hypothetical protein VI933_04330 [archaeon]|nr:hypothetical protein [archaeon]